MERSHVPTSMLSTVAIAAAPGEIRRAKRATGVGGGGVVCHIVRPSLRARGDRAETVGGDTARVRHVRARRCAKVGAAKVRSVRATSWRCRRRYMPTPRSLRVVYQSAKKKKTTSRYFGDGIGASRFCTLDAFSGAVLLFPATPPLPHHPAADSASSLIRRARTSSVRCGGVNAFFFFFFFNFIVSYVAARRLGRVHVTDCGLRRHGPPLPPSVRFYRTLTGTPSPAESPSCFRRDIYRSWFFFYPSPSPPPLSVRDACSHGRCTCTRRSAADTSTRCPVRLTMSGTARGRRTSAAAATAAAAVPCVPVDKCDVIVET